MNFGTMGWGMGFGWIIGLILLCFLFWFIYSLVLNTNANKRKVNSPTELLRKKYANGEISTKEYEEILNDIQ